MQEVQARETGEVGVEGDKSAAAVDREGSQVGIGPHPVGQIRLGGEGMEGGFQMCWFTQKPDIGQRLELMVDRPSSGMGLGVGNGFVAGDQAQ